VIFPLVSKSTFDDDQETTRRYINVTMRYSLIFATAIAVVMAANPRPLLDIPYADDYATLGAPALCRARPRQRRVLAVRDRRHDPERRGLHPEAIIGAAVTLAVALVGNLIAIPRCEPGADLLVVAASVTAGDGDRRGLSGYFLLQAAGRVPARGQPWRGSLSRWWSRSRSGAWCRSRRRS
jgi:hypothetical protein